MERCRAIASSLGAWFTRRERLVPLLGFLFVVVVGALPECIPLVAGKKGQTWSPINSARFRCGDAYYYAAWMAEVTEGKIPPKNPGRKEGQSGYTIELFKVVPQVLAAVPGLVISDNRFVYLISLAVFPGILFLLGYRLARFHYLSLFASLCVGVALVFFLTAWSYLLNTPGLKEGFWAFTKEPTRIWDSGTLDYDQFSDNYRFLIPSISSCVTLALINVLASLHRRPGPLNGSAALVLLWVIAFTYLPAGMCCYLLVGGLCGSYLLRRDWKRLGIVAGIGLCAGAGLLAIGFPRLLAQGQANTAFWTSVFEGAAPVWDRERAVSLCVKFAIVSCVALAGCWRNRDLGLFLFLSGLSCLGVVAWAGWKGDLLLFSKLFWRGFLHPWIIMVLIGLASGLRGLLSLIPCDRWGVVRGVQLTGCAALAALFLVLPAAGFTRFGMENLRNQSRFIPDGEWQAFDWLRRNTPDDSVVMAMDWDDIYLIPIYTRNNLYFGHMQISNRTPADEVRHFLGAWRVLEVPREDLSVLVQNSVAAARSRQPHPVHYASADVAEEASFATDLIYWPYSLRCGGVLVSEPTYAHTSPEFHALVMDWYDRLDWETQFRETACDYVLVSSRWYSRLPNLTPKNGFRLLYENQCRRIYALDKTAILQRHGSSEGNRVARQR